MSTDSLPKQLADATLARLVSALDLQEVLNDDGSAYMTLDSHAPMAQGKVGEVRVFKGGPLYQLVSCSIVVPQILLDSHMIFAFMPSESAVPHFTLDSVKAGDHCAFHLDLIPRVDLGSQLEYMDEVFTPLTAACKAARQIEGLSEAQLDPRQYAVMSPWMLVQRANDDAFSQIEVAVNQYMDHWLSIVESGISKSAIEGLLPTDFSARDERNKAIIFNPEVDKVWQQIGGLIGSENGEALRKLLKSVG